MAALPLVRELKRVFPQQPILLSTATATGRAIAERSAQNIAGLFFIRLTIPGVSGSLFPGCVRSPLSPLKPSCGLIFYVGLPAPHPRGDSQRPHLQPLIPPLPEVQVFFQPGA